MACAEYSLKIFKPIFAYRQTVWTLIRLLLEEQSDLGSHCLQKGLLKSQAVDKADDNCCGLILFWDVEAILNNLRTFTSSLGISFVKYTLHVCA